MPKSKHPPEFRAKVSQEYIDGIGSMKFLANKYGIGYSTLKVNITVRRSRQSGVVRATCPD